MNRVDDVNAFVLHQRQYRETSSIVDFFTERGPLSAVCRGVYGAGKSAAKLRATLQPFTELSLCWFGRNELKTIRQVEPLATAPPLRHNVLYAALYVNELLLRLAPSSEQEGQCQLYTRYKSTLSAMRELQLVGDSGNVGIESCLRIFELQLLEDIGFAVDFHHDWLAHQPIDANRQYSFDPQHGFAEIKQIAAGADAAGVNGPAKKMHAASVPGWVIVCIRQHDFSDAGVRRYAKRLARETLALQLGERPLKTRELFT